MLIIFGGLSGVGKTTLSKLLSQKLKAVYLRIDTIEQTLSRVQNFKVDIEGYMVAAAIARENISLGHHVIIDAVNSVDIARQMWRDISEQEGIPIFQIEVICSNKSEHRRRVETRYPDIQGHILPTWSDIDNQNFELWRDSDLVLDTHNDDAKNGVDIIIDRIGDLS